MLKQGPLYRSHNDRKRKGKQKRPGGDPKPGGVGSPRLKGCDRSKAYSLQESPFRNKIDKRATSWVVFGTSWGPLGRPGRKSLRGSEGEEEKASESYMTDTGALDYLVVGERSSVVVCGRLWSDSGRLWPPPPCLLMLYSIYVRV